MGIGPSSGPSSPQKTCPISHFCLLHTRHPEGGAPTGRRRDRIAAPTISGIKRAITNFLIHRLRVAPRKSNLRKAAIDDQFRSGHEGGIVAREEQGCLCDFPGLAETMKRDPTPDCRGRCVELLVGKSELAVKWRADQAVT